MSFNNSAVNACKGLFFFLSLAFTRDPLTSYHLTSVISWSSEPETFINSRGFTSINSRTLRKSFDSCSIRLVWDFVTAFRALRLTSVWLADVSVQPWIIYLEIPILIFFKKKSISFVFRFVFELLVYCLSIR